MSAALFCGAQSPTIVSSVTLLPAANYVLDMIEVNLENLTATAAGGAAYNGQLTSSGAVFCVFGAVYLPTAAGQVLTGYNLSRLIIPGGLMLTRGNNIALNTTARTNLNAANLMINLYGHSLP